MKRKIIFIIVGAFLILALIFVLWFWFFGRNNKTDVLPNNGSLGTAQDAGNAGANGGSSGNGQAPYGSDTGTGASNSGDSGNSTGGASQTPTYTYVAASTSAAYYSTPYGVTWFGVGASGGGFSFNTTPPNGVSGGTVSGSPYIPSVTGADGSQVNIFSSLLTVIGGCLAEYGIEQLAVKPIIAAEDTATTQVGNLFGDFINFILPGLNLGSSFQTQNVNDTGTHTNTATETVTQCLTRTLGRIAVAQITQSTVNWINSGFNGQPAYVQDFGKFFSDVADQSAGNFIQGTGLAFLCSPFQLQVKIAIAQAYANSRSGSGSSCTLTDVSNNIEGFLKGDFSQGGWPAFLQFTTVPANNPYGGYIQGQLALNNQVIYDTSNANTELTTSGYLPQKQCTLDLMTGQETNCTITTPSAAVNSVVNSTFQGQLDQLQLGDSIDQILGALANSLISKIFSSGGLANVNNSNNTPNAATTQAQTLMNSIQAGVTSAQQYATIEQGAIGDIQNSQRNLATLADCWSKVASSTSLSSSQVAQGQTGFNNAVDSITQLQNQVVAYNNKIASANASIVRLQSLQTDLLLAGTQADVTAAANQFAAFKTANNPQFFTSTDVTTAQQDRASIQSSMNGIDQNTSTQLSQCYAVGQ